jgi:hypothetical protein
MKDDKDNATTPAKPILKKLATPTPLRHRRLPAVTPVPDETVPATTPVAHSDIPATAVSTTRQQTALSITREIQKNLALMKKAFLRAVMLLGQVRDEKLYTELGSATMEDYAATNFGFKPATLYTYLRVYDGLRKNHPEMLKPGAKVKLADLNDADDLVWIEKELARESLPEAKKTALQNLQGKALDGTLRRSELRAYKSKANNKIADGNRAFLAKLRSLRTYGASLAGLPEGVIAHLQAAIDLFKPEVADVKQKAVKKGAKRPTAVS